jgi:hypothetical protein
VLHRGVFSDRDSQSRRKKKISLKAIRNKDLAIDGYNVIITLEAGHSGRPLVLGDDAFFRDISGLSGSFRRTEKTEKALEWIFDVIKEGRPRHTLFLFDAPISKSGRLAEEVRDRMHQEGIPGDARAINVPEKILIGFQGVVATSDTAIIDQSEEVVDLAGEILKKSGDLTSLLRFKKSGAPKGRI